jgi:hypothetical protein
MLLEGPSAGMWNRLVIADAVEGLAGAAMAAGRTEEAATLLGSADALRERFRLTGSQRMDRERVSAAVRERLGAERFELARRRGEAMTVEEILAVIA